MVKTSLEQYMTKGPKDSGAKGKGKPEHGGNILFFMKKILAHLGEMMMKDEMSKIV